jgi:hypothetical protein
MENAERSARREKMATIAAVDVGVQALSSRRHEHRQFI